MASEPGWHLEPQTGPGRALLAQEGSVPHLPTAPVPGQAGSARRALTARQRLWEAGVPRAPPRPLLPKAATGSRLTTHRAGPQGPGGTPLGTPASGVREAVQPRQPRAIKAPSSPHPGQGHLAPVTGCVPEAGRLGHRWEDRLGRGPGGTSAAQTHWRWGRGSFSGLGRITGRAVASGVGSFSAGGRGATAGTKSPGLAASLGGATSATFKNLGLLAGTGGGSGVGGPRGDRWKDLSLSQFLEVVAAALAELQEELAPWPGTQGSGPELASSR